MATHWHIIGLGWLGSALAQSLITQGIRVSGTCRAKENADTLQKQMPELEVTLWDSSSGLSPHIPPGVSHLVFAVPPSGISPDFYAQAISAVAQQLKLASPKAKFIFTSSTSVYPEAPGKYNEQSVVKGAGSQVVQVAEEALLAAGMNHWIIRLSGLAGYGRVPGRYFAGKQVEGEKNVNLIHRDDIVSFILQLADDEDAVGVVNLSCPETVTRKALYSLNAKQYRFESPIFLESNCQERLIISVRTQLFRKFTFKYRTPLDFPVK